MFLVWFILISNIIFKSNHILRAFIRHIFNKQTSNCLLLTGQQKRLFLQVRIAQRLSYKPPRRNKKKIHRHLKQLRIHPPIKAPIHIYRHIRNFFSSFNICTALIDSKKSAAWSAGRGAPLLSCKWEQVFVITNICIGAVLRVHVDFLQRKTTPEWFTEEGIAADFSSLNRFWYDHYFFKRIKKIQ